MGLMTSAVTRWLALRSVGGSGIVFTVGFVVFVLVAGVPPSLDASGSEMRAYLADRHMLLLAQVWIGALVFVVFLPMFAVSLQRSLNARGPSMWPAIIVPAAWVITALIVSGGGLFWTVGIYLAPMGLTDESARILFLGDMLTFLVMVPWGLAMFTTAIAMSIRETRLLPGWLVGAGLAVAALLVVGTTWIFEGDSEGPLGFLGLIGLILWVAWLIAVSVSASRHPVLDLDSPTNRAAGGRSGSMA